MAVTYQSPYDNPAFKSDVSTVVADLNSGNYLGAWNTAESSDKFFGTPTNDAATKDPLLLAMQNAQGLQLLDPTKKWDASSNAAYFKALGQSQGYTGANDLGKNPYGLWGSQGATQNGTDSRANIANEGLTPDVARFAGAKPSTSFMGKYGMDIVAAIAAVAAPYAIPEIAAAMGGGTAAAIAAGAIYGAGTAAAGDLAGGRAITGRGVLGGAVGGAISGGGLASQLGGGVQGATTAGALGGAARGLVSGQNIIKSAEQGAAGGAIGSTFGPAGTFANQALGNPVGKMINGSSGSTNMMTGGNSAFSGYGGGGGGGPGNFFSGLGGLGALYLGGQASNQQGNMQNNAYTTLGNAANAGNQWGVTGAGGMGSNYNNGMLNMNPGMFGPAANGFAGFAGNQTSMANMYGNGQVPGNVTNAFGGFNNALNTASMFNRGGQGTSAGVMGMGANMLGSANANYNTAYNTALNSGLAALNPQIQQQSNALLNSNFERGMSGTSGGALQTQALQNSFNTADLQAQNQAVGQGLNAFNSTIGAGTSMFNTGAGNLGSFNNAGAQFGQLGMSGAMNYNMFSPQLASMYNNNAIGATTGFGNINSSMINANNAGLQSNMNVGTDLYRGGAGQVQSGNTYGGGAGAWGAGVLGSPGVMNNIGSMFGNLAGGAGNLFNWATGAGNTANNNWGANGVGFSPQYLNIANGGAPDMSQYQPQINQSPPIDMSMPQYNG